MSFSEQQIRQLVREEVRRIIDAGLMYTAEAKPQLTPQSKPEPQTPDALSKFPENLRQHLTLKDGKIYKKFVAPELFEQMNKIASENGYRWISNGKESHWSR